MKNAKHLESELIRKKERERENEKHIESELIRKTTQNR